MGIFSNKDKPCPICGKATPRLLAKKIQGEAICNSCADNIMAEKIMVKNWSMDDLKEHLQYREENQRMLENFNQTRSVDYEYEMVIDDSKQLFYIKQWVVQNPPIFHFNEILGFEIMRGYETVESWSRGMQRTPYQPPALGLASGISMLADAFSTKKDKEEDEESYYENLKMILKVNTKYLQEYEVCDLSISGKGIVEFEQDFARELSKVNTVCNLIISLTNSEDGAVSTEPISIDPNQIADQLKKYKELLDIGAITQEEFSAKKKQILGL